jgi:membrane fusion protein (multidrug efflux system)
MTKRMIIMLLLATVVFGGIFGMQYMGKKGMNDYFDNMPVPPAAITTTRTLQQTWQTQIEAPGSITAVNGTTLTSEAGGLVTAILFESGKKVKKGDLLVQLDSADERAELARLQAQSDLAQLNSKRREKLYGLEAISKSDVDTSRSEVLSAKAAVESQRAKLAQKDIRAPFDGTVGIRQVNLGEYLPPGGPIVTLQSLDPVDIDFDLPDQRVGQVEPGFPISVITEAFPDRSFKGEVLAIEPRVDPATRNFKVRARVPNPDLMLRPGQFGKVRLDLPVSQNVVVIPRTAIDYSAYGNAVYVVQKKKQDPNAKPAEPMPGAPPPTDLEVTQRFVKTGPVRGDFIAILEGLKEGEEIATSGLLKLRNGQPVIVNNEVQSKPVAEPTPPQG